MPPHAGSLTKGGRRALRAIDSSPAGKPHRGSAIGVTALPGYAVLQPPEREYSKKEIPANELKQKKPGIVDAQNSGKVLAATDRLRGQPAKAGLSQEMRRQLDILDKKSATKPPVILVPAPEKKMTDEETMAWLRLNKPKVVDKDIPDGLKFPPPELYDV